MPYIRSRNSRKIIPEKIFFKILDNLPSAIVVHNSKLQVIYINKYYKEIFVFDDSIIGKTPFEFIPETELKRVGLREKMNFVLKHKKMVGPIIDEFVNASGEKNIFIHKIIPVLDEKKEKVIYVLSYLDDITSYIKEKESLQNKLVHYEKLAAVGQMAAGLAHEFNNLLSVILWKSQHALIRHINKKCVLSPELFETFKVIQKYAEQASEIISALNFSKPDEVKIPCYIYNIVEEVLKVQENFFNLENIKIIKKFSQTKKIFVNKSEIYQVILNLIINARHAISPKGKGKITISTHSDGESVYLDISDTGIGIPEKNKRKLFTPFFTTKVSNGENRTSKLRGTGLGLYMSHQIINKHFGTLTFSSEEGEGTTFTIKLPALKKDLKIEESNLPLLESFINEDMKRLKILIVDDLIDNAEYMADLLRTLGFKYIGTAYNADSALLKILQDRFHVAFIDIVMPKTDGIELIENINKSVPDNFKIPEFVFLTAHPKPQAENFLKQGKVRKIIKKPCTIKDIIRCLIEISHTAEEKNLNIGENQL